MSTKNWKHWPLYVWLFALYPVLFLFSQNIGRVIELEVGISIGVVLLSATLLLGLAILITRDLARAGAVAAIAALAILTYGHVYSLINQPGLAPLLTVLYAVLTLGVIALIAWKKPAFPGRLTPHLNLIGIALILMTLPPVVRYEYYNSARAARAAEGLTRDHPRLRNSPERPDIYYIVLDGYSSNAHLLREFGHDNTAFTQALEERGFYVAYDSKTTYPITVPSLFASLNMRYLNEEDREAAQQTDSDVNYLRGQIADNVVAQELQARGYTYVFMLSGYAVPSTIAEVNIDFHPGGPVYFSASESSDEGTHDASQFYQLPFVPLLLETTAFLSFADQAEEAIQLATDEPYNFRSPNRALKTWEEAEKIPQMPEATFTVIHIIKPHEPIAFDRDGQIVSPYPVYWETPDIQERFFEQLEFINARTLRMLDTILEESSTPPIIILQADHGSYLGSPLSEDRRRIYFEILNAYYFPGRSDCGLTQDTIPINSFRVMLNCYFGGSYPLQAAKYYRAPKGYNDLFRLVEVGMDEWEALLAKGAGDKR